MRCCYSMDDPAKAPAAGRRVISFSNSGNPWRQQRLKGDLRACTEIVFRSGPRDSGETAASRPSGKRPDGTKVFAKQKPGFAVEPLRLKKGDRDVQSEPESRPAKPESRTEAGPAAGRWPEARTAAAGSEPSG